MSARLWVNPYSARAAHLPDTLLRQQVTFLRAGIISPQDMASVMELTSTQQEIVCEVLGSVSVLNGTAPNRPPPGSEAIYVHELSLLAFLLLYSKESQSQRAENLEVWPEAGHVPTSFAMDGIMSPTRSMGVRTSLSGASP